MPKPGPQLPMVETLTPMAASAGTPSQIIRKAQSTQSMM